MPKARIVKAFNLMAAPALEAAAWSASRLQPNIFYVTDAAATGEVTRGLIGDAGFKPVNAGPLNGARQLEQVGVLLHHITDHEYGGDADLIRLALTVVEASPGPIVRERVA